MQFLNIDDSAKIIFLVKSHHHQLFSNGKILDLRKITFPIFYKFKYKFAQFHEVLHFSNSPT